MNGKPAVCGRNARFVTGSIMRHVLIMAGTGTIGLMAVFAVDLLNLIYIAHLGDPALTAAIGFAGTVSSIQIAVSIGLTIGMSACIGREIGAGRFAEARRISASFLLTILIVSLILGSVTAVLATPILRLLGASGSALDQAGVYLHIVSPCFPAIALGMACSALMRTVGDARRSMNVTLAAAILTAVLDPLLILGLHLGLTGAAVSSILSRTLVLGLGLRGARLHDLPGRLDFRAVLPDTRRVGSIALPAILTNLATPVGAAWVTQHMARFGLDAISGQTSVDRIVVVAFSFVFALTGAVGPIMSQNLGAGQPERVRQTLLSSLRLSALCVGLTWLILALTQDELVLLFHAHGTGAELIHLFCSWTVAGYLFVAMLFVANTAFNNLGYPLCSTLFNWGRATLGTIPFVSVGARYGATGVQIGQALGSVAFGTVAIVVAFRVIRSLGTEPVCTDFPEPAGVPTISADAAMAELDEIEDAEHGMQR